MQSTAWEPDTVEPLAGSTTVGGVLATSMEVVATSPCSSFGYGARANTSSLPFGTVVLSHTNSQPRIVGVAFPSVQSGGELGSLRTARRFNGEGHLVDPR
jgi:hypothetical protein